MPMENVNKILIIPALILWSIINFSFAVPNSSDCGLFASKSYNNWDWFSIVNLARETNDNKRSNFLSDDQQIAIMPRTGLNVAVLNLKKYCCEHELWWIEMQSETCQNDKKYFNDNALDSQYLFDHIFDVMMRRLNWLTWDNNIYPNVEVDRAWAERRARISEKAENLSWSDAQSIIDEYTRVRKQSPSKFNITNEVYGKFKDENQKFLRYISWEWDDSTEWKKVAETMKKYNERTLYDKYINACALTEYFYALLTVPFEEAKDKGNIIQRLSNWLCDKIVAAQIDWENAYVQLITQRSSNLFLSNYIDWYVWYLYNRETQLKNLRKNSTDRFLDVVRAVPNLVHKCVK